MRRAFASTTSAPAFGYDAYGNALQATAPVTDFNFAGMFYNADSGLGLTQYRAYDPVTGRWLSRDPLGEASDPAANLYRYADGDPVALVDPEGRQVLAGVIGGAIFGGGLDLAEQLAANGGRFGCVNWGEVGSNAAGGGLAGLALGAFEALAALRAEAAAGFAALRAEAALLRALEAEADAERGALLAHAGRADVSASTPVGRSGNPIYVRGGTNQPGSVYGRDYTGHAFDQMQGRGIPPSAVEDAIQNGVEGPGNVSGTTAHYSSTNNLTAVTDSATGRVVTVRQGPP